MNVRNTPRSPERREDTYNLTYRLRNYDSDNLYPQNIMRIVSSSGTASTCLDRFIDFIEGNGIASVALSRHVINRKNETLDDIHHLCAADMGRFGGFAIHVNYDISLRPCELQHIPFEDCRIEEPDDDGNVAHICVHEDWSGKSTRGGRRVMVTEDNIDRIDVFNPEPSVVAAQIEKSGGLSHYKGQVLYYSQQGYMIYPRPIYDAVLTDISSDEGLSNITNRNARNNFLPSGIVSVFRNRTDVRYDDGGNVIDDDGGNDEFVENLVQLQGDTNACKLLVQEVETKEEMAQFTPFAVNNFDKDFTASAEAVQDRIYSKFGQEGWLCIRKGKVGFGGELLRDVESDYCRRVAKYQRPLSQAYYKILSLFDPSALPDAVSYDTVRIEPYLLSVTNQNQQ